MLSSRSIRVSRIFSQALVRSYVSAPAIKPFHYQQLLEHEKKIDTPYKKLTGVCLLLIMSVCIYDCCVHVCLHMSVFICFRCDSYSWWRSIVVRPPVLPACFAYPVLD